MLLKAIFEFLCKHICEVTNGHRNNMNLSVGLVELDVLESLAYST
jgi:hypothetical protein